MSILSRKACRAWLGFGVVLAIALLGAYEGSGRATAAQINSLPAVQGQSWPYPHHLTVTSTTFMDGSTLPQSMILNALEKIGEPIAGCAGGDESPQLSWYGAPRDTRSFVVMMFDIDASFTHWGMYNIAGTRTSLPQNAGVAGSKYGLQVNNDYGYGLEYDGPCPPSGQVHHYVITVYALDGLLNLSNPYGFIPGGETLLAALLEMRSHILDSGSISGIYFIPKT
jgi:Raf kinase inhibitor-like YbhB/YbcL family protein